MVPTTIFAVVEPYGHNAFLFLSILHTVSNRTKSEQIGSSLDGLLLIEVAVM